MIEIAASQPSFGAIVPIWAGHRKPQQTVVA
jgi:hypothetical protein